MMQVNQEVRDLLTAINPLFPPVGTSVEDADEARRLLASIPRGPAQPVHVGSTEDISIVGPDGDPLALRVYRPDTGAPERVIVFVHGGGWVLGSLDSHDPLARRVCQAANAVVVSVDYRLAPEHPYPAALNDVEAALDWVDVPALLSSASTELLVMGESAGGNLALAAALRDGERDDDRIDGLVLLYPVLDDTRQTDSYTENATGNYLTAIHMEWFWRKYLNGQEPDAYAAPTRYPELATLPRMFLAAGVLDPLRDEALIFGDRARQAGVDVTVKVYPAFHGFVNFPALQPAQELLADIASFTTTSTG